jgi:hypothetical protein
MRTLDNASVARLAELVTSGHLNTAVDEVLTMVREPAIDAANLTSTNPRVPQRNNEAKFRDACLEAGELLARVGKEFQKRSQARVTAEQVGKH